mmetsp:Transcript_107661/g.273387  ORF Transcript_107661/g.273387 Transcript_107661/m.273387 type:complete len:96 (+) Transcript_107661:878-1165(+)
MVVEVEPGSVVPSVLVLVVWVLVVVDVRVLEVSVDVVVPVVGPSVIFVHASQYSVVLVVVVVTVIVNSSNVVVVGPGVVSLGFTVVVGHACCWGE